MCSISEFIYHLRMCPKAINREYGFPAFTDVHMHMNACASTMTFFSNIMIILLCENFISHPKSGSETGTYLIEL